jgi:hypothetical protein
MPHLGTSECHTVHVRCNVADFAFNIMASRHILLMCMHCMCRPDPVCSSPWIQPQPVPRGKLPLQPNHAFLPHGPLESLRCTPATILSPHCLYDRSAPGGAWQWWRTNQVGHDMRIMQGPGSKQDTHVLARPPLKCLDPLFDIPLNNERLLFLLWSSSLQAGASDSLAEHLRWRAGSTGAKRSGAAGGAAARKQVTQRQQKHQQQKIGSKGGKRQLHAWQTGSTQLQEVATNHSASLWGDDLGHSGPAHHAPHVSRQLMSGSSDGAAGPATAPHVLRGMLWLEFEHVSQLLPQDFRSVGGSFWPLHLMTEHRCQSHVHDEACQSRPGGHLLLPHGYDSTYMYTVTSLPFRRSPWAANTLRVQPGAGQAAIQKGMMEAPHQRPLHHRHLSSSSQSQPAAGHQHSAVVVDLTAEVGRQGPIHHLVPSSFRQLLDL